MALSFTEIVNQLNALSCLHGDDDDDDGVLKRARKATAKPAASSQGLLSPFFHLFSPCYIILWTLCLLYTPLHHHHFFLFFLICPSLAVLSLCFLSTPSRSSFISVSWSCCGLIIYLGPCGDVPCCEHISRCSFFFWSLFFVFWQCGLPHSFSAIGSEPNKVYEIQINIYNAQKSFLEDKSFVLDLWHEASSWRERRSNPLIC